LKRKDAGDIILLLSKETSFKSDQIFCRDILQIFYEDNHLQLLLDLEQISFIFSAISLSTNLIVLGLVNKNTNHISQTRLETNYIKEKKKMKIWNKIGKKISARWFVTKNETNCINEEWRTISAIESRSEIHKEKRPLNRASEDERMICHTTYSRPSSISFL